MFYRFLGGAILVPDVAPWMWKMQEIEPKGDAFHSKTSPQKLRECQKTRIRSTKTPIKLCLPCYFLQLDKQWINSNGKIGIIHSWSEPGVLYFCLPLPSVPGPSATQGYSGCGIYLRKMYDMQMWGKVVSCKWLMKGQHPPGLSTFELRPLQMSSPLFFLGVKLFLLINCLDFYHYMLLLQFFGPGNKSLAISAGALWFMQVTIGDLPVRRYNWVMSIISEL